MNVTTWEIGVWAVVSIGRDYFRLEQDYKAGQLTVSSGLGAQLTVNLIVKFEYASTYPIPIAQWANKTLEMPWSSTVFLSSLDLFHPFPVFSRPSSAATTGYHPYPVPCFTTFHTAFIPDFNTVICSDSERFTIYSCLCEGLVCEIIDEMEIKIRQMKESRYRLMFLFRLKQFAICMIYGWENAVEYGQLIK